MEHSLGTSLRGGLSARELTYESMSSLAPQGLAEEVIRRSGRSLELLSEIGSGGFGSVWLVYDPVLKQRKALKVVCLNPSSPELIRHEMRGVVLCTERVCNESPCLAYLEAGDAIYAPGSHGPEDPPLVFWYLMQVANNAGVGDTYVPDTLRYRLHPSPSRYSFYTSGHEIREIIDPILEALSVLHGKNLVHRDIKPENIWFVGSKIVLGDFGLVTDLSDVSDGGVLVSAAGTMMMPEVMLGKVLQINGRMQDLYNVGGLIRIMLGENFWGYWGDGVLSHAGTWSGSDPVLRSLNQLALKATSNRADERYDDVDSFRRDYLKCFPERGSGPGRLLMASLFSLVAVLLAIAIGLWFIGDSEEPAPASAVPSAQTAPPEAPVSPGVAVDWFAVLGRTALVRDYVFGSVMPKGVQVRFTPAGSGIGFFDQGNLRLRRHSGFLGESGITLQLSGPLPRSFELIWLSGGDFGGMTETVTLRSGGHRGVLSTHVMNGSFGMGALGSSGAGLSKQGFMGVHRLICINGTLRLLVDGLIIDQVDTGISAESWDSLTLHYDVRAGGELYFSSIRLYKFVN